jgi:hypothetical protein
MNHAPTVLAPHWPQLIMVHGLMESGKSTLATYLIEEHGYKRVKFADTLKNMIRHILRRCGVSPARIEDYVEGDFKKVAIPELNDPSRPDLSLENLPDAVIMELVAGLLSDAGLTDERIAYYAGNQDLPVQELRGVTTVRHLYDTLRHNWSRQMLRGEIVTCRRMMQTLGEEWRNLHSHKLWAYISLSMSEVLFAAGHRVVIDDNRYRFEFEPFSHLLYFRFVVTRGKKHFLPVTPETHQSEIPMPVQWFDAHLRNDFTIQFLRDLARMQLDAFASYRMVKTTFEGKYPGIAA